MGNVFEEQNAFDEASDFIFGVSGDEIAGRSYNIGGGGEEEYMEFDPATMSGWHILMCTDVKDVPDYVGKESGKTSFKLELTWKVISPSTLGVGLIHPEKNLKIDDPADGLTIKDFYYINEKSMFIANKLFDALRIPFKEDPNRTYKNGKPIKQWHLDPQNNVLNRCVVAYVISGTKREKRIDADGQEKYIEVPSGYPQILEDHGRRTMQPVYDDYKQCVGSDMPF